MKHENMTYEQRERLEKTLKTSDIREFNVFTEEPYIEMEDGTIFSIDVVMIE